MRLRIFLSGVLTALCSVLAAAGLLALAWVIPTLGRMLPGASPAELSVPAPVVLPEPDAGVPVPAELTECAGEWSCWETVRTDRAVQCACEDGGAP